MTTYICRNIQVPMFLQLLLTEFGKSMGQTMGDILVKQLDTLDARLQRLHEQRNSVNDRFAEASNSVDQRVATTPIESESVPRVCSLRTEKRKMRRKRCRSKFIIQRNTLLQMRPRDTFPSAVTNDDKRDPHGVVANDEYA